MSAGDQRGRKPCADVQRNRAALLSAPRFWLERPAARLVDDTGFGPYDTRTRADL